MFVLNVCLFVVVLGLFGVSAVLLLECLMALLPLEPSPETPACPRPRVAVLIPAHNEAAQIETTLKTALPQLRDQDELVVVADNCSDETAAVSRAAGATVIERQHAHQLGKGYALDYGLAHLAQNPPDVVIMIDADCIVHPGTIEHLARQAMASGRPVQSVNLLAPPARPTLTDLVSSLAFTVKNLVRPLGLRRLGLPCLLTGTGMAFPWAVMRRISLADDNIVEDMQLGINLTVAGYPASLCPQAKVSGILPEDRQAARSQRTRWEHGHLATLTKQVPSLLQKSYQQQRFDLFMTALDLAVPPLSLLVFIWIVTTTAAAIAACLGGSWLPLGGLGLVGGMVLTAILSAWAKYGRHQLSVQALLAAPLYVLWKIPIHLAFLLKPQTKWVQNRPSLSMPAYASSKRKA